jgi:hypothetical protein
VGGDDELADLRRRAFSRDGTAEDLRRLAELETPAATPVAEEMAEPEPPAETVVDAVAPRPAITARSRLRGILLAGAVGITLGATAATLGIQFAPRTEPTPAPTIGEPTALAIFDREPGELDDPARLSMTLAHILPGGLEDAELRWLGAVAEREVYVARGSYDDVTTICLISATSKSTGAACTDQSDFAVRGLSLGDGQLELRWGPLGTEIWVADRP